MIVAFYEGRGIRPRGEVENMAYVVIAIIFLVMGLSVSVKAT
jgi:hypothetical protein